MSDLYPYQRLGSTWLRYSSRALLADEMGLGKTVQAIAALPRDVALVVICPAVVKYSWRDELRRWRPDLEVRVLEGRGVWFWPEKGAAVIANPEILPDYLDAPEFPKIHLVLDECHYFKNPAAKRTRRVRRLAYGAARVYGLSGTPITNRPEDLFHTLESLGASPFDGWDDFRSCFRKSYLFRYPSGRGEKWILEWPKPELAERLRPVMLRRLRRDVLPDLPPKIYREIVVGIDGRDVRDELDAIADSVPWDELVAVIDPENKATTDQALLGRLMRARRRLADSRVDILRDLVRDFDRPVVVFSAHRTPVEVVGGWKGWAAILGDTPSKKRAEIVAKFQAGELKGIAMTIATAIGITLTRASDAIFLDLSLIPSQNAQAEDRICRIGQTADVCQIVHVISDHPLDRWIYQLVAGKAATAAATLGDS